MTYQDSILKWAVWQKPLQYYKVISLQLIKIIGKKMKWAVNQLYFNKNLKYS